jgi:hypothetical protein
MNVKLKINMKKCRLVFVVFIAILIGSVQFLYAQEPPPRPVEVTVTGQGLNFGAFSHSGSGGTVTVTAGGIRSGSAGIYLINLGYSYTPALLYLVADPGTVVSILNGSNETLTGSGGGTLTLEVGDSDPSGSFVINTIPPAHTELRIGGILTVGDSASNPPGTYTGSFDITLVQE